MTERADVVVVGGGIIGCGVAAELASRGVSVVLVERSQIGAGASGRNHGLIFRPEEPELDDLARVSLGMYAALADESPIDPSLDRTSPGLVIVAREESDWPAAEREAAAEACAGAAVQRLDEAALREAEPALAPGLPGGFLIDDGFRVDPAALTLAYAERARAAGAQVWTNTEVKQILLGTGTGAGAVRGVATDAGVLTAPTVVNAAGPWAAKLARTARADCRAVPIGGMRGWLLLTEARPGLMRHLVVSAGWHLAPGAPMPGKVSVGSLADEATIGARGRQLGSLVQQNRDGHILLGGSREHALSEEPLGADVGAATGGGDGGAGVVGEIARRAAALVPALGDLGVTGAWSGVRPTSPDRFPIIGWVPGVDGLFVAGGHGGAGVVLGGGSARLAAQLLVGETPFTDPAPFDPARFVTGSGVSRE
ncbi:MAG TPA: FAD-dependent oxidoreductase [Actinomycetota bacterium]|jgi:sarcosine oxidase subunit beta|nr:FAD-dependent oxidoreductase [Actinomycetota bacterium]